MPKFYVQSGSLRVVTTASDSRGAAIWAVHRALSPALPFLCEGETSGSNPEPAGPQPQLGEIVHVSQQGFDRGDAQALDTLGLVSEWNQLLVAIDCLERRLVERASVAG